MTCPTYISEEEVDDRLLLLYGEVMRHEAAEIGLSTKTLHQHRFGKWLAIGYWRDKKFTPWWDVFCGQHGENIMEIERLVGRRLAKMGLMV